MRSVNEAFSAIFRSPGRALVSVLAISMALVLFGVFGLLTVYAHGLMDLLRKNEEISVYIDERVSDGDMLALDASISQLPGVETTRIVSKDDAAVEFERMFGENLLSALERNPLPRSIVVTVAPGYRTADGFTRLGKRLDTLTGVESVEYGREWMAKMDFVLLIVLGVEITLGALVGIAGIMLISNSIAMTVIVRREAIEIMRLVGATERFIRSPFYLEGIIQGFAAGLLACGMLIGPYFWARHSVPDFEIYMHTFGISLHLLETAAWYLVWLVPAGSLLGLLGSGLAIRRSA